MFSNLKNTSIFKGYSIYLDLRKKYGKRCYFLLAPHPSTGDAFIIGSYFKQYCKSNNINEYVYICVGKACAKILFGMFNVSNILLMNMYERDCLESFLRFMGEDNVNIKILHYQGVCMYTGIFSNMRCYKNITFIQMMKQCAFRIPLASLPDQEKLLDNHEKIEQIFKNFSLEKGKTVLISPTAGSIQNLSTSFWEKLAAQLQSRGFSVCTNLSSKDEIPIENTYGIFFPHVVARDFLNLAGFFVGFRSGFCDIISNSNCKKIIIYPNNQQMGVGSFLDYFSLKKNDLANDCIEIEFNPNKEQSIIDFVLKSI